MPNKNARAQPLFPQRLHRADFDSAFCRILRSSRAWSHSSDLPLNSRARCCRTTRDPQDQEQHHRKILAPRCRDDEDKPEDYAAFYATFGRVLKEGLHFDFENADKIKALLMFPSAKTEAANAFRQETYRRHARDPERHLLSDLRGLGDGAPSPHIEAVVKRGYDVLFFVDAIDQWIADNLGEFGGRSCCPSTRGSWSSARRGEGRGQKKLESAAGRLQGLLDYMKEQLKSEVNEVRLSPRLTDSVCCLVADEHALSASMERLMKAMNQEVPKQLRTLELNPEHALLKRMKTMLETDKGNPKLADYVELLYGQALLGEGGTPKNPQKFTRLVSD
jgi:molecular chaperone HtpG